MKADIHFTEDLPVSPDPNPTPGEDGGPPLDPPPPPAPQTLSLSADTTFDLGNVSGPLRYDGPTRKIFVPLVPSSAPVLPYVHCSVRELPAEHLEAARATALAANPANDVHPALHAFLPPQRIAMITTKWWGADGVDLSVQFLDAKTSTFKNRVLAHMNEWGKEGNVRFRETSGVGDVRIARTPNSGYWSYLGTDIRHVPAGEPTMNLDSFSNDTPESEFIRVVRHETGHTLGFPHEHQRQEIVNGIDVAQAIAFFGRSQGWSPDEVRQQVLTALDPNSLRASRPDSVSIMCYALPGAIMKNGQPVPGGRDLDALDREFVAAVYPKKSAPPVAPPPPPVIAAFNQIIVDLASKTIKAPSDWRFNP